MADAVATLTLDDPARRNALSLEMTRALSAAVSAALEREALALVVAATPPVFCAGGSIDDLLHPRAPLGDMYAGFEAIASAPVPTVAAVGGPALGAGMNVALACDVIVCSPEARFDARFVAVGLHPGGGQLWRLAERAGRQAAAALSLFGETLTGAEAERRGLAWRCVPGAELEAEAVRLASRAASYDAEVVARTKHTLDASATVADGDAAVALELDPQRWSMSRPQFADALASLRARLGKTDTIPGAERTT